MSPSSRLSPAPRRFVMVDDSATFRELVQDTLQRRYQPLIFEGYALGRDGIAACCDTPPDLLIVDLYLHDMDGRDIVRELRRQDVNTRILAVTAHPDAGLPADLVQLGVAGFVDKHSPIEQLERAVQRLLDGGMFFSASVRPPAPRLGDEPAVPAAPASVLSEREREVVRLVARGLASKEIGSRLGLSTRTVEKHRARILARLGLHDIPTLVRWCLLRGLG
ncbi:response regulator transcription factor [Synoicihabitans lomoniglobus]|uniref:Response regulator transcription factor n=1 Tax=Synoicihabitans lomoniglobus TaxID=2909285 RepID=A0AAF0I3P3_9BACT|nr:response regulator transcription factor [Opitutaceae bacterium LMO-M01]WED66045.1 response regulator transcription factor [Opitutaceae bacterium LMO-M01]